jgi:hypothetical protein
MAFFEIVFQVEKLKSLPFITFDQLPITLTDDAVRDDIRTTIMGEMPK